MLKNELSKSSSPYLLQHKNNPVHWQEWSEDILEKAKAENKCLLISIGYSACHWCHVMAHECFENDEVADLMNKHFINIKIDREERPDIDQIYMDAAQILTGRGGWPLNAFALPDGRPFYAGTYFPKENWIKVLTNIAQAYKEQPNTIIDTAKRLTEGINNQDIFEPDSAKDDLTENELQNHYKSWYQNIDFKKGGIDKAPKFPMPCVWQSLLEYHATYHDKKALEAVEVTLDNMLHGGIYDWVGGGFSRYSVDEYWFAPHFEKMLYDNAQLISLYADAFKITQNPQYQTCVEESIDFLNEELKSETSGYYSALDADSEGEEGLYYTWTFQELEDILSKDEMDLATVYFNLKPQGNWENQRNILAQVINIEELAKKFQYSLEKAQKLLGAVKTKLKTKRDKRVKPGLDNKLITAHNAMLVKAFVKSYQATSYTTYKKIALDLMQKLIKNSINSDYSVNRLMNKSKPQGFLDDYAFMIEALIFAYEISFEVYYLKEAEKLIDYTFEHFYDDHQQLFYYANKNTQLIARKIEFSDNVIPSSNAVMAENLWRLGHLLSKDEFINTATSMLYKVQHLFEKFSLYFANWHKLNIAVIKGQIDLAITGPNALSHAQEIQKSYHPYINYCGGNKEDLPQLVQKTKTKTDQIFICQNKTCTKPLTNIKKTIEALKMQKN